MELFDVSSSTILQRGQIFFDKIYGKISNRVMRQMDLCGTEDLGIAARLMYAYILSNTSLLTATESSFVIIAGLVPQDVSVFILLRVLISLFRIEEYTGESPVERTS